MYSGNDQLLPDNFQTPFEQFFQIDLSPLMSTDWYDIDMVIACTDYLGSLFKRRTALYQELETKRQECGVQSLNYETFEDEYFFEGLFGKDMKILAQLLRVIKAGGASRIRFEPT